MIASPTFLELYLHYGATEMVIPYNYLLAAKCAQGLEAYRLWTRRCQGFLSINPESAEICGKGCPDFYPTHTLYPSYHLHRSRLYLISFMLKMEAKLGVQCYVYYIIDLHGLSFDPTLVGTLTGPYRVSWQLVNQHYREFVERYIFIHTPSYLSVIGKAIARLVPEKVRRRIMVIGKEWPEKMLEIGDRDYFPKRYGGEIPDEKVLRDPKPVPKNLYWRPRPDYPSVSTMYHFSIPAGKSRTLSYYAMAGSYLFFYSQN
ncbi:hypothetical protein COOONC_18311, partial [Cooperia oncophora]